MNRLRINPESSRKQREFTAEEDFLILERILPRLKFKKLSTSGFLLTSDLMELAGEFHRNHGSVRERWEGTLQPWLLQNLTGTSGLRVELMLANLVIEKLGKDKVVAARKEIFFFQHIFTVVKFHWNMCKYRADHICDIWMSLSSSCFFMVYQFVFFSLWFTQDYSAHIRLLIDQEYVL